MRSSLGILEINMSIRNEGILTALEIQVVVIDFRKSDDELSISCRHGLTGPSVHQKSTGEKLTAGSYNSRS
jgi:hypothetical protein